MEQEPAERTPVRYPDPAVQILDPSFARYRIFQSALERLATGFRWAEGPVWFGDGRYLLWSDIPNNRIMRWEEETGRGERVPQAVELRQRQHARPPGTPRHLRARQPARHPHRVRRHHHRARSTASTASRLNSPNDVVVKSDDSIWFTDPPFGILGNYEGHVAEPELPTNCLSYRRHAPASAAVVTATSSAAQRALLLARRVAASTWS